MADDRLLVCLHEKPVGHLDRDDVGRLSFSYSREAQAPLSLSMPLSNTIYGDHECEVFFGGLLPEGDAARDAIARRFNADADNTFSLLKAIGKDCAGAISFHDPDEPPSLIGPFPLEGEEISDAKLAALIRDLPRNPLFIGVPGLRMSLAGFQHKAAVCLIDGKVCLPNPNVPTTHILKPAMAEYEGSTQNEYLCLSIAAGLDINAASVQIRKAEDQAYVLVKRYDRRVLNGNKIERVHQEDFCQALGVATARKYESEGGPGFQQCFDLLKQCDTPAIDRTKLAKFLIFNFLVGNSDAHGKNFSVLHRTAASTTLAPMYDVVSLRDIYDVEQRMAMSIGGCFDARHVTKDHWQALCKAAGFGFPAFQKLLREQVNAIEQVAELEREKLQAGEFQTWVADSIIYELGRSCSYVREQFAWSN